MVSTVDDFLRRRTNLALTEQQGELDEMRSVFARLLGLETVS